MFWLLGLVVACRATAPLPAEVLPPAPVLSFEVHDATGAPQSKPRPTVIALHGLGDRPQAFVHVLDACDGDWRVLAPAAPLPWPRGTSWFSKEAMRGDAGLLSGELRARSDDVARWMDVALAAWPAEGRPVLVGFSQGAMMSYALSVTEPHRFRASVPVAGFLPRELAPDRASEAQAAVSIRALHGQADEVVDFTWGRRTVDALRVAGFDAELTAFPEVGHAIPAPVRRALCDSVAEAFQAQPTP